MRKNFVEIKEEVLRGLTYNQHQKRMIVTILTEYPKLVEDLKKFKKEGAQKIDINYDHSLTEPKVVLAEKDSINIAVIYINK